MDIMMNKYDVEQGLLYARDTGEPVYFVKCMHGVNWYSSEFFKTKKYKKEDIICVYEPKIDTLTDVIIKIFNLKQ